MAAQWEPDPMGRAQYRYFDGFNWTHVVATNGVQSTESSDLPLPIPQQPPVAPYPQYGQPMQPQYGAVPYGYGYQPVAPQFVQQGTRVLGWVIGGFGLLIVLAAFLPWLTIPGFSVSGLGGHGAGTKDGVVTLPLGLIAAGLGLARGVATRRSGLQLTAAIIALVIGVIVAITGLVDIGSVGNQNNLSEAFGGVHVSVGFGLILTLLAGIGLTISSIIGVVKRT